MSTVVGFQVSLSPPSTTCTARRGMLAITVRGETDMFTAPLLRVRIHEQIRRGGPDLVIDLTEVSLLSAAGLSVLNTAHEAAITAEVGFCLVASTRPVLLPLRVTALDGVLACYPDLDSARAASSTARLPEPLGTAAARPPAARRTSSHPRHR